MAGPASIANFLRISQNLVPEKWRDEQLKFPAIRSTSVVQNPKGNKWEHFDVNSVTKPTLLYVPQKVNFPKYDWLTVAMKLKLLVRIGSQSKHGGGKYSAPDPNTLSIFFTTLGSSCPAWKGWIVMNKPRLINYLGPTIANAAHYLLLRVDDEGDADDGVTIADDGEDDEGCDEPAAKKARPEPQLRVKKQRASQNKAKKGKK